MQAVARRLLAESNAALHRLPCQWLDALLARVTRPNQTRTDIVRRSAGIPLAFLALCLAEAQGASRTLLPTAIRSLLVIARGEPSDSIANESTASGTEDDAADVQPWPRVHAFNCLRTVFDSAALAADASGFFAEGIEACVLAMTCPDWEVRSNDH